MSNYTITIDQQEYMLSQDDSQLDMVQTGDKQFHILQDGQSYKVVVIDHNYAEKTLNLEINGNPYTIAIADKYDLLVKEMGLSTTSSQKIKNIKAPMPGLILDILIEPGQSITKGDQLLILEAMKMENVLKAEGDGVVKSIEVQKSAAVDKGQILIEME